MSLKIKAAHSALWQLLGGGWLSIVRLVASFFLARALTPEDYGIFGVAILMRMFIERLGSVGGISNGLIAKKNTNDADVHTCFWFMALVRVSLFVITLLVAPIGGWFFNDERVVTVVRVISLTFLFSILGGVPATLLGKDLKFKELNIIRCSYAVLETSLSVFLALNTSLGYWVLVIGAVLNSFFSQLTCLVVARWMPRFVFSRDSFKFLYRYAVNGLGFSFTDYLKQNLDYILVGRLLGTASLGLYEFAYRIPHMVQDQISKPVGDVVFPALSKVKDSNDRLVSGYIRSVKYVCFLSFPLLFGLVSVADVAIPLMWGDQWLSMINPLRILCVCAALRLLVQSLSALYLCKDRPDIPFKISLFELVWTVLSVGILAYHYSIIGVAFGMMLSVLPSYYFLWHAFKMLSSSTSRLAAQIFPSFLCSIICMAFSFTVSQYLQQLGYPLFLVLISSVTSGAAAYILSFFTLFKRECIDYIDEFKSVIGNKGKI